MMHIDVYLLTSFDFFCCVIAESRKTSNLKPLPLLQGAESGGGGGGVVTEPYNAMPRLAVMCEGVGRSCMLNIV